MRFAVCFFVVVVAFSSVVARADADLGIAPVQQATPVWCWIAVGEMVFRKYDVPAVNSHYQCGVVGAMAIASNQSQCVTDCRLCNVPGGDATTVMGMLIDYPKRAATLAGKTSPRLFVTHADALTPVEVRRELDAGRPIVAGINPGGRPAAFAASAHVALVEGYADKDGELVLIVNDPFPFSPTTWPDPYLANGAQMLRPGQYGIRYSTYISQMGWVESFLVRGDGKHTVAKLQCLASRPMGTQMCGAPPTSKPGQTCQCGGVAGVVVDQN